jgi:predicted CXXCH cytochrome family protein
MAMTNAQDGEEAMKKNIKNLLLTKNPLLIGAVVGILAMLFSIGAAQAAPAAQEATPPGPLADQDCKECHLDIANTWESSPHAHAFDDPVFQERWSGLGSEGECLLCHTTNYQSGDGSYTAEGVSCEACHGKIDSTHPPAVAPVRADTEYCGSCHTVTLHEWRLTGHAAADVGCTDCHDPHSQDRLFAVSDDLCINCHKEAMGDYLEDLHIQKDIGCVDCHALVIPPDPIPADGIVPTGHAFSITPATCVACHTDALHAGFSLPGYENGASAAVTATITATAAISESEMLHAEATTLQSSLTSEQQIQALETALASRQMGNLFQGGLIGLVLGGSTAWFVARNTRRSLVEITDSDDEKKSGQES